MIRRRRISEGIAIAKLPQIIVTTGFLDTFFSKFKLIAAIALLGIVDIKIGYYRGQHAQILIGRISATVVRYRNQSDFKSTGIGIAFLGNFRERSAPVCKIPLGGSTATTDGRNIL